jgi:ribosome biogenesis protein ENP2
MQVYHPNNVKIYSVTSASRSAIPDWVAKKAKRALKDDQDYTRRIDLVQDFDFPEASNRIKISPDGKYILATGTLEY